MPKTMAESALKLDDLIPGMICARVGLVGATRRVGRVALERLADRADEVIQSERWANGRESLTFASGQVVHLMTAHADAFRGEQFDLVAIDVNLDDLVGMAVHESALLTGADVRAIDFSA